ncbi:glycosyltransferase family 4 protein [Christiangramia sabulilitoris]|uniref:Glycosyltransferase family 4 protein n=1 Tax=Christiangramia sabulilitoris TaxID=2583991 RepID=A0A550HYW5_9FLAO|nr:glycosyltransferase family 1 protein [Christiangramia sabulilitoris]TRO63923.1 glycosyltransferase family 4 protein [Christiangramia sabulilitoris]
MSNILINIPDINKEYGGVYQYSIALIKILAKGNLPHQFFIFCNNPEPSLIEIISDYNNFHFAKPEKIELSRTKIVFTKILNFIFWKLGSKKRLVASDCYDKVIKSLNIDIIHTPYQHNVEKKGVKSVTTLHDVQELHFPEFFNSGQRAYRAVNYKKAIDGADAVVVSYNHVKKDILKYFKKPEEKVFTVLLDMQNLWLEIASPTIKLSLLEKYSLPPNFILYPASTWEHKNHIKLCEAMKVIKNEDIYLVCTGNRTPYYYNKILPFIENENLSKKILFLGIVSDNELLGLYKACRAVIVPTLYEAGSFPLMESILLGIPVVCSNVTSLPETIGDDRFIFDPMNAHEISEKIMMICRNNSFREKNLKIIKEQAKKLRFNNAALKFAEIYNSILKN